MLSVNELMSLTKHESESALKTYLNIDKRNHRRSQLRVLKPGYHLDSGVLCFYCAYPCAYILFINDFTLTQIGRRLGWERGFKVIE